MANVLVVHHDGDMADEEADWLRRAGHNVTQCAGPSFGPCPILHDRPCPAVGDAEVLVYDIWATGDALSEQELIERIREQHPDTPIVLTSPGLEFEWVEIAGPNNVIPVDGVATAADLQRAVETAVTSVAR